MRRRFPGRPRVGDCCKIMRNFSECTGVLLSTNGVDEISQLGYSPMVTLSELVWSILNLNALFIAWPPCCVWHSQVSCGKTTIYTIQGPHGHGKSWKILKFETILESHGFLSFFKKSWKTDISRKRHGKVMEFYTNRQFCARRMAMAVLWIAYTSSLPSFTLSRECIY